MKFYCLLLIPRHLSGLLFVICSFHFVFLWNNISITTTDIHRRQESLKSSNVYNSRPLHYAAGKYQGNRSNISITYKTRLLQRAPTPLGDDSKENLDKTGWDLLKARIKLSQKQKLTDDDYNDSNNIEDRSHISRTPTSKAVLDRNISDSNSISDTNHSQLLFVDQEISSVRPLPYSDSELKNFYHQQQHGNRSNHIKIDYMINPRYVCVPSEDSPNGIYMIVMVHSNPANKPQRDAIRDTWGRVAKQYDTLFPIRVVFVLGIDFQIRKNVSILKEAKLYRDILLGSFVDSYKNLSVKSLFAIRWVHKYCQSASYMLKTDDDTYINTTSVVSMLNAGNYNAIGAVNRDSKVMRSGLWDVQFNAFPFAKYPAYCTGCAYVLSTSILTKLLVKSQEAVLIPVEDAFITGILLTLIGETCQNSALFPQWHMGPSSANICQLIRRSLIGIHSVPYYDMYSIHKDLTLNNFTMCSNNNITWSNIKHDKIS